MAVYRTYQSFLADGYVPGFTVFIHPTSMDAQVLRDSRVGPEELAELLRRVAAQLSAEAQVDRCSPQQHPDGPA